MFRPRENGGTIEKMAAGQAARAQPAACAAGAACRVFAARPRLPVRVHAYQPAQENGTQVVRPFFAFLPSRLFCLCPTFKKRGGRL